jgi:hypothetical protein
MEATLCGMSAIHTASSFETFHRAVEAALDGEPTPPQSKYAATPRTSALPPILVNQLRMEVVTDEDTVWVETTLTTARGLPTRPLCTREKI